MLGGGGKVLKLGVGGVAEDVGGDFGSLMTGEGWGIKKVGGGGGIKVLGGGGTQALGGGGTTLLGVGMGQKSWGLGLRT